MQTYNSFNELAVANGASPNSVFNAADRCISQWDVNSPIGNPTPGTMVVITGNAPLWKFCNLFHKAIVEHGAAIVAVGQGDCVDGSQYVVGYSTEPDYPVGQSHCPIDLIAGDDLGDLPQIPESEMRPIRIEEAKQKAAAAIALVKALESGVASENEESRKASTAAQIALWAALAGGAAANDLCRPTAVQAAQPSNEPVVTATKNTI